MLMSEFFLDTNFVIPDVKWLNNNDSKLQVSSLQIGML